MRVARRGNAGVGVDRCEPQEASDSVERHEWRGRITSTKGNRVRYVPMTVQLANALLRCRHLRGPRVLCHDDGRPLTQQVMIDLLAKVGRLANVRSNGPISASHVLLTSRDEGRARAWIQELAGHRDLTTTQKSMHLSRTAVADAIRLLDRPGAMGYFGDMVETATR